MKRLLIGIGVVAAMGFPATASASSTDLGGDIDPSGTISMTVKKGNHGTKVTNLEWHGLPVSCDAGDYTAGGQTGTFAFKVKNGQFGAKLFNGAHDSSVKITGKLTNHGHKAHGTIRQQGHVLTEANGSQNNCDSGTKDWSAAKVV